MWLVYATITIVTILLVEVLLRMFALGIKQFCAQWINSVDLGVSLLSLTLEIIVVVAQEAHAR